MIIPKKNWRTFSSLSHSLPAKAIRKRFLDYFIEENDHKFIRSSSVRPQFDSSIPFVNAGMCQFKEVFIGEENIDCSRAANSQKCIRIGGKHNDTDLVGFDSFHHTFFEMLGNWSFGSYGKKEACSFAWELLTTPPFSIPPRRLFVTYFSGDKALGLPADEEIREVWRELGVPADRILPFPARENFWEMGVTGPCGTCTEIHVALTDEISSRSDLVNGNNPLLAELWNIVFIKFDRTENGLSELPREYIDTGMGFERLVSLLQGKTSNYDTDLFQPLFRTIETVTNCPPYTGSFNGKNLDFAFRRLADFCRMVTVAVADDLYPDVCGKLRRMLRKAFSLATVEFNQKSPEILLAELARRTAESLSETYPEIGENLNKVNLIIKDEALLVDNLMINHEVEWRELSLKYPVLQKFSFIEYPGLPDAYRFLLKCIAKKHELGPISPNVVLQLFNTYGLDQQVVQELAGDQKAVIDWIDVERLFDKMKLQTRKSLKVDDFFETDFRRMGIKTDESWKHECQRTVDSSSGVKYSFPPLRAKLLAILGDDTVLSICADKNIPDELKHFENAEVPVSHEILGLIFDKTNFSCEIEDRRFDTGCVTVNGERFSVFDLRRYNEFIVHYVKLGNDRRVTLKAGTEAILELDSARRLNIMKNNVLTHLMLFKLRDMFPLLYLQYDNTESDFANVRCCVHGNDLNLEEITKKLETLLQSYVREGLPVERSIVPSKAKLLELKGLKLRPSWIYSPRNIELISILDNLGNVIVREPSSDVHVHNTSDLENCCILYVEKVGEHLLSVTGFTGAACIEVNEFNNWIESQCDTLRSQIDLALKESCSLSSIIEVSQQTQVLLHELIGVLHKKKHWVSLKSQRYVNALSEHVDELNRRVNQIPIEFAAKFVKENMLKQAQEQKCVVYFSFLNVDDFKIRQFVTEFMKFDDVPVLFVTYVAYRLRGYCYVPETHRTENFNSATWLKRTFSKTGLRFKLAVDELSYPGFNFLSHVIVKQHQIDHVRKIILNSGVSTAIELSK